jgi:hypothetical protein
LVCVPVGQERDVDTVAQRKALARLHHGDEHERERLEEPPVARTDRRLVLVADDGLFDDVVPDGGLGEPAARAGRSAWHGPPVALAAPARPVVGCNSPSDYATGFGLIPGRS